MKIAFFALAALVLGLCSISRAGVLEFGVDLNTPADKTPGLVAGLPYSADAGLGMRLGLGKEFYRQGDRTSRWWLDLGVQRLAIKSTSEFKWVNQYHATSLEVMVDRDLWANSILSFGTGVAFGWFSVRDEGASDASCDLLLCALDNGGAVFSGSLYAGCRISRRVGIAIRARRWVVSPEQSSTYPFAKGVVLTVGVQLMTGDKQVEGPNASRSRPAGALRDDFLR